MLTDSHARPVTYLRLSVTDRCNFRCVYCMPPEGLNWFPPESLLQDDEIITLLEHVYLPVGIARIRITGGEPLLRKGLPELIARIDGFPQVEDISLSTNALFLGRLAAPLRQAGLKRVNISLDSLNAERFRTITHGGQLSKVLAGIEAAVDEGLLVKLNAVIVPGMNDDEVLDLAELTQVYPLHVRFIEMMPVGNKALFEDRQFVPIDDMLAKIQTRHPLIPADGAVKGNGPAKLYRLPDSKGTVGFITPMSREFCHDCNRTRLTADGKIKACLMRPQELDLLGALRHGEPYEQLRGMIEQSLGYKPLYHDWAKGHTLTRSMSQVGG